MFASFQEAKGYIRDHAIEMIDLKFCDTVGPLAPRHRAGRPVHARADGARASASTARRWASSPCPPGTWSWCPTSTPASSTRSGRSPTLSFLCTTLEADTRQAVPVRPAHHRPPRRGVPARRPASPTPRAWGPEFEFYLFDGVSYENGMNVASYRVESRGGRLEQPRAGLGLHHPAPRRVPRHPAPGPPLQRPHQDLHVPRAHGRRGEVPPPRGGRAGPVRDRDADPARCSRPPTRSCWSST